MRRTVTLRTTLHALIAAPLLLAAWPAIAPVPAPAMAEESPDLVISIVIGLAPDDLLNVRATASPIAKVETRLAGGASVTNLGCNDVNGYKWCKIEETGKEKLSGWAPARYLIPLNPAAYVEGQARPADAPMVASAGNEADAKPQITATADTATSDEGLASRIGASASDAKAPTPATTPPDLSQRLGADPMGSAQSTLKSVAEIGRAAMQDAYGLAFAAQENPTTGEIKDPAVATPTTTATVTQAPPAPVAAASVAPAPDAPVATTSEQAVQEAAANPDTDPAPTAAANSAPAPGPAPAGGVPVPTPRPDQAKAASAAAPQTVASVEPPQPLAHPADATGEIPCARYVGQPMAHCAASVVRSGTDKADITVTWPDGGTRVISFYAGQPAGSDARSDFRFTREGSLNMIRVGVSERFEITDQLALGD